MVLYNDHVGERVYISYPYMVSYSIRHTLSSVDHSTNIQHYGLLPKSNGKRVIKMSKELEYWKSIGEKLDRWKDQYPEATYIALRNDLLGIREMSETERLGRTRGGVVDILNWLY